MNDPKRSANESARRTCNLLPSCKWASRHVVHPLKLSKVIECEPPRSPSQARHGEAHFGIELHGVRQVKISKHFARTDFHRFTASASLAHIAPHNRFAVVARRR